jgi:hypothetical protein
MASEIYVFQTKCSDQRDVVQLFNIILITTIKS